VSGRTDAAGAWRERPWYIIGCGRLGTALAHIANRHGIEVQGSWNRSRAAAERVDAAVDVESRYVGDELDEIPTVITDESPGAVVWLTVADDALPDVAERVASSLPDRCICLHTCGSRGSQLLSSAGATCEYGVAHPLWAVSDPVKAADGLATATWSLEGTGGAIEWMRAFVDGLGARSVTLEASDRALYHAAAVTAANLMVGALEAAVELAEHVGMTRTEAQQALWPLALSALENVRSRLEPEGLTGPVARGDETTVERHLDAIEATGDEELRSVYASLTAMCRRLMDRGE
jgi:predicted short-subunit dehydrogenase-like oxidoreductase (DUF2520 family)